MLLRIFRNSIAEYFVPLVECSHSVFYVSLGKIRNDAAENPQYYCKIVF